MKRLARIGIVPFAFILGLLAGGLTVTALAGQPHMVNALNSLLNAQHELQVATADKGGHRASALNLVNQAIQQVRWGINYAR